TDQAALEVLIRPCTPRRPGSPSEPRGGPGRGVSAGPTAGFRILRIAPTRRIPVTRLTDLRYSTPVDNHGDNARTPVDGRWTQPSDTICPQSVRSTIRNRSTSRHAV